MPDVYISYAQGDRKRGEALSDALSVAGWVSASTPETAAEARTRVAHSAAVIVCWSRASVKSDAVFATAAQAYNQGKLISVLIQDAQPPEPYNLVEAIDIGAGRGENLDPLMNALRALAGAGGAAAVAPNAAPDAPSPISAVEPPRPKPQNLFQPVRPAPVAPALEPGEDALRSRVALITVIAMALAIAALWAGPRVIDALNRTTGVSHKQMAAHDDLPPAPNYGASAAAPAPVADQDGSPPPASSPVPEVSTPVVTPVGDVAKKQPPSSVEGRDVVTTPVASSADTAKPALDAVTSSQSAKPAAKTDPAAVMTELEKCLGALAKECPQADPALLGGFAADGRVSTAERRLLNAPLFPDRGLVTGDNLKICTVASKAKSPATLAKACAVLAPKPEAAKPEAAPKSAAPAASSAAPAHVAAPPL